MITKVPFWQPAREYNKYKTEIDEAIHRILSKGELVLGFSPDIDKFEEDFAKFIGTDYAVMTGSGTQSLFLAYKASGIGPGDEVITTSHTFIATIDQIVAVGATPILVDIDRETGLIDLHKIEEAITEKTKAVVVVHLEGKVCEMESIVRLTTKHNLILIEDAAQAVGAFLSDDMGGKRVGSIGNIGCFSFYPAKILGSYGNAGAITTNDEELADRIKMLRCNSNIGKNKDLDAEYGYNLEPDNIQAAILNVKLKYLHKRMVRRRDIALMYDRGLRDLGVITAFKQQGRVYQDYVIRSRHRDQLNAFLNGAGVSTLGANLIPNHHYNNLNMKFDLPNTCDYIAEQIRIPCNPDVTDAEVEYVIKTIKKFYDKS